MTAPTQTEHTVDSVLAQTKFHRTAAPGLYTADTPAGPAVIERVRVDGPKGGAHWRYDIETTFTGDQVRFRRGYVTYKVARRAVALLAANHLNEQA
jgi:hypothetical protein